MGSGAILREVLAGADLLASDFGVAADVWSVTSFTELRRNGIEVERWNRLHPTETARVPYVSEALGETDGPFVAATDYMRSFADQIREWVPGPLLRCSAPTASAGATTAGSSGASSRSTATTSRSPRSTPRPRGEGQAEGRPAGDREVRDRHRVERALGALANPRFSSVTSLRLAE